MKFVHPDDLKRIADAIGTTPLFESGGCRLVGRSYGAEHYVSQKDADHAALMALMAYNKALSIWPGDYVALRPAGEGSYAPLFEVPEIAKKRRPE